MKYNTMMALAVCGALAFAVTGCKYDDVAEGGDGADSGNVQTVDTNDGTGGGMSDINTVTDPIGKAITGLKFDQDPNYMRCTDVDFVPVYFAFDSSTL